MLDKVFGYDDLLQQVVGGFLLSGAFIVTEEVWKLGEAMNWYQFSGVVILIMGIGYFGLYGAEKRREEQERKILRIPYRFISLLLISVSSVVILAYLFSAPEVFQASSTTIIKTLSIACIFSTVGAITADNIF
ncbi:MAG: DUF2391 domain-containing protein [bacterium]